MIITFFLFNVLGKVGKNLEQIDNESIPEVY